MGYFPTYSLGAITMAELLPSSLHTWHRSAGRNKHTAVHGWLSLSQAVLS